MDWHTAGRNWLQNVSNRCYLEWSTKTKNGIKYKSGGSKGSPYKKGFSLPDWFNDAIDALNKDQEERFKAIKMMYHGFLYDHLKYMRKINGEVT